MLTSMLQLRKGKRTDDARGMVDLSYFRPVAQEGFEAMGIEEAFNDVYGQEPRLIKAILPGATADDVWSWRYEEWGANNLLKHACDGDYVTVYYDQSKQEHVTPEYGAVPCPYHSGERRRTRKNPGCRPSGHLQLFLPELVEELQARDVGTVGVVTLKTTSIYDCLHITEYLESLEEQQKAAGKTLLGFELVLRRVNKEITCSWDGGRKRAKKWMIQLAESSDFALQRLMQAREAQLMAEAAEVEEQIMPEGVEHEQAAPKDAEASENDQADIQQEESTSPPKPPKPPGTSQDETETNAEGSDFEWTSGEVTTFFTWANEQGVRPGEAMEILDIEQMTDYAGRLEDAKQAVLGAPEPSETEEEEQDLSYDQAVSDDEIPF